MSPEIVITVGALAFATNIFTSVLKLWIYPNFGKLGVQVTCFVLATVGAFVWIYGRSFPGFWELLVAGATVFSTAVAMYEVIFSKIDIFKVTTPKVEAARIEERG